MGGAYLGHENGALMNGASVPQSCLALLLCEGEYDKKSVIQMGAHIQLC